MVLKSLKPNTTLRGKKTMNDNIRRLLAQAYLEQADIRDTTKIAEQFAELIVKETLQVARAGIAYGDGMEDAVYKYFGVKE
jgi:hypothetical protein